jgi:hypothetical protein
LLDFCWGLFNDKFVTKSKEKAELNGAKKAMQLLYTTNVQIQSRNIDRLMSRQDDRTKVKIQELYSNQQSPTVSIINSAAL